MFTGLWERVIAGAALIGAVLLAIVGIRNSGKEAERNAQTKRDAEAMREAKDVERKIDALPDDSDEYRRLRDKWTRR